MLIDASLVLVLASALPLASPLDAFVSELVSITPGQGKFPSEVRLGEGAASRTVRPAGPFRIARYEVPQDLYELVMGSNPSRWRGPRNSVEMVSHADAVTFCEKLTALLQKEGKLAAGERVDLPSDAEWEYACRAGAKGAYSFGDDAEKLGDFAWFTGNAAGNDPPVGAKKPNAWGLYDMHGYVWEWRRQKPGEKSARAGGGAWTSPAKECRSDAVKDYPVDRRAPDLGFRVVVRPAPGR